MSVCVSVSSLQDSCCRAIVRSLHTVHDISRLPLPVALRLQIKSFADSPQLTSANCTLPRHVSNVRTHRRSGSDVSQVCASSAHGVGFNSLRRNNLLTSWKRLAGRQHSHPASAASNADTSRDSNDDVDRRHRTTRDRDACCLMWYKRLHSLIFPVSQLFFQVFLFIPLFVLRIRASSVRYGHVYLLHLIRWLFLVCALN